MTHKHHSENGVNDNNFIHSVDLTGIIRQVKICRLHDTLKIKK